MAMAYVVAVLSGTTPACKWVRLACQRQVDDLARIPDADWPYRFDEQKAHRICRFAEGLVHVKAQWAKPAVGDPRREIHLEPWQCFILTTLFGWVGKDDDLRRFTEFYGEIPRKNAKSTLAAIIGLWMFVADGEVGPEVYSGATKEKQALEVFGPARLMALKSPKFKEHYGLTIGVKNVSILDTAAKFEPLVGDPGEGASPSCFIVDEYHEHRKDVLYDAMETGTGSREQPLGVVITTAGENIAGPCYAKRTAVTKVLERIEGFENEKLFCVIYTVDKDDSWEEFDTWIKANPNYAVSVLKERLKEKYQTALRNVRRRNVLLCRHLNIWNRTHTAWMDLIAWRKCADTSLSMSDFVGCKCWIGLDLASKVDIAAMRILFRRPIYNPKTPDEERLKWHYYSFGKYYLPEDTIEKKENEHYRQWREEGWLTETEGAIIDFEVIEDDLVELKTIFQIEAVGYDPFQATEFATRMAKEGMPMVEIPAIVKEFSEPMKQLEASVIAGTYHHNGDPVQTWMISNVVAREDKKDNIYPVKEARENKIDGVVADIMAVGRAIISKDETSIYERRDVRVVG